MQIQKQPQQKDLSKIIGFVIVFVVLYTSLNGMKIVLDVFFKTSNL